MTLAESVYSEGFASKLNESSGLLFLLIGISFRNWKLEMLQFLKNKLSRISAAHHFYLAHSLTLSFIGGYVVLFECFSFDWKWKFHQEKQIFWGYENFLSSHEYISLSEKNVGVIAGSFILCVTHCHFCCKTYDTWVEISLFFSFFFCFCFWVRQDFHIFSPTLVRTKVEVKPVVIVFRYFIFMVKLILSYHKSNMNSQFLTDVLSVFSTIWFPSTWESLKRWISAFICAALFPITETTDFFMLYYVIIAEHS